MELGGMEGAAGATGGRAAAPQTPRRASSLIRWTPNPRVSFLNSFIIITGHTGVKYQSRARQTTQVQTSNKFMLHVIVLSFLATATSVPAVVQAHVWPKKDMAIADHNSHSGLTSSFHYICPVSAGIITPAPLPGSSLWLRTIY